MSADERPLAAASGGRIFATTCWTVVLEAGGPQSPGSEAALEQLCRTYWYPLYFFARREGHSACEAEDLTQSFFAHLLEKRIVAHADPGRGRFRSFLLAAFKNFGSNQRVQRSAAKRGGGSPLLSFEQLNADGRYEQELRDEGSPEKLYDQKWAVSVLDQVTRLLQEEYTASGKGVLFVALRGVVSGRRQGEGYDVIAREMGMSEGSFKVAVHRFRTRFREKLRLELAQTVAVPDHVDDELRHLLSVLSR
jgi:RNA polymerase sigma-70 factor (ECF subfamily)